MGVQERLDREPPEQEEDDDGEREVDRRQVEEVARGEDRANAPDPQHHRARVDDEVGERPQEDRVRGGRRDQQHEQDGQHPEVSGPLERDMVGGGVMHGILGGAESFRVDGLGRRHEQAREELLEREREVLRGLLGRDHLDPPVGVDALQRDCHGHVVPIERIANGEAPEGKLDHLRHALAGCRQRDAHRRGQALGLGVVRREGDEEDAIRPGAVGARVMAGDAQRRGQACLVDRDHGHVEPGERGSQRRPRVLHEREDLARRGTQHVIDDAGDGKRQRHRDREQEHGGDGEAQPVLLQIALVIRSRGLVVRHDYPTPSKIARGLRTSICSIWSVVTPAARSAGKMSSEMCV